MSKLLQLYNDNRLNPIRRCAINAASKDEAEILLYDAIGGFFGIDAEKFIKDLKAIDAKTIHLRVNSPGGDVNAARAVQTALAQHPAKVVAHVDGLAASAASVLILGADEIEASSGAFLMVHNPWTVTVGDEGDHRASADMLSRYGDGIAHDYARRTGKSEKQAHEWMDEETWFTADEARDVGLVDRVVETIAPKNQWDLSAYAHVPQSLSAAASAAAPIQQEEAGMPEETQADATQTPAVENAPPPEPPPTAPDPAVSARTEALTYAADVSELCALAGFPARAAAFIRSNTSIETVRSELLSARAVADAETAINSHVLPQTGAEMAGRQPQANNTNESPLVTGAEKIAAEYAAKKGAR